jgi:hypothetical protein
MKAKELIQAPAAKSTKMNSTVVMVMADAMSTSGFVKVVENRVLSWSKYSIPKRLRSCSL